MTRASIVVVFAVAAATVCSGATAYVARTDGIVNNTCAPPPPVSQFLTTDTDVYLYALVDNVLAGDVLTVEWENPSGMVVSIDGFAPFDKAYSSACFSDHLSYASGFPAGQWIVHGLWRSGGTTREIFTVPFMVTPPGGGGQAAPVYYRFESGTADATASGSIVDSSGSGQHGTPYGSVTYSADVPARTLPVTGATNNLSLSFQSGGYIQFPGVFPLNTLTNATMEFWIKPSGSGEMDFLWTRADSSDANRFNMFVLNGAVTLDFRSPDASLHVATPAIPISNSGWTHVAVVKSGNTWTAYSNGVQQGSPVTMSFTLPNNTGWTMNGRNQKNFTGLLDEFRITAAALTPSQFLNAGASGNGGGGGLSINLATGLSSGGTVITTSGTADANWTVDRELGGGEAAAVVITPASTNWYSGWLANSANSAWIARYSDKQNQGVAHTYHRRFDLGTANPATATISGWWAVDSNGTLRLNGQGAQTLPSNRWGSLTAFTFPASLMKSGVNELTITIDRADGQDGVRLEGSVSSPGGGGGGGGAGGTALTGNWQLTATGCGFISGGTWQATIALIEAADGALSGKVTSDPLNSTILPDQTGYYNIPVTAKSLHSGSSFGLVAHPAGWVSVLFLTGTVSGSQISGKVLHYTSDDCTSFTMVPVGSGGGGTTNLLTNGSFELPGGYDTLGATGSYINGWTVSRGNVDYIRTYFTCSEGSYCLDLDGTPGAGGVSQTFQTTPGTAYTVAFDVAGNPEGAPAVKQMRVQAGGQSADFSFDITGRSASKMGWTRKTWSFAASGPTTTIEFYSLGAGSSAYGPALDNVVVTAGGSGGSGGGSTCAYQVPTSASVPGAGWIGSLFNVLTAQTCTWSVNRSESDRWITITHPTPGSTVSGNDYIFVDIPANPSTTATRLGTITVTGTDGPHNIVVTQGASCSVTVTPPATSPDPLAYTGGSGSFQVTTSGSNCPWTATAKDSWITGINPASGTTSTTVRYTVASNSTQAPPPTRSGTITVSGGAGDQTFTVVQANVPAASSGPVIATGGIVNAASYASASPPNGGVAPGSYISIYGSGLGPNRPEQAGNAPATLSTTLGGVSIKLTSGSTSVDVIPTFVAGPQVNAIVPSNAPLGDAQLTVSYNGATSAPASLRIVRNALGIFTMGSTSAAGIIQTFPPTAPVNQRPLNSATNTAAPGDYAIVWATGLGANIVGGQMLSDIQQPQPNGLMEVPITITIGGIKLSGAQMPWQGRSGFSGVDNVYFIVPEGVPSGCAIPVQIQVGDLPANTVTIAVDPQHQPCTDPGNPFTTLLAPGNNKVGMAVLEHVNVAFDLFKFGSPMTLAMDMAVAGFVQIPPGAPQSTLTSLPALGSCAPANLANVLGGDSDLVAGASGIASLITGAAGATYLDAGTSLWLLRGAKPASGADNRTKTEMKKDPEKPSDLSYSAVGSYSLFLEAGPPFLFADTYELTNAGAGGQGQVGTFSVQFDGANAFNFKSNASKIDTVDRAQPLTVTWSGGDPAKQAVLIAAGNQDPATKQYVGFECLVPMAAGQFTVPASVMAAIPPSPPIDPKYPNLITIDGMLLVLTEPYGGFPAFSAQGLDRAVVSFGSADLKTVRFR